MFATPTVKVRSLWNTAALAGVAALLAAAGVRADTPDTMTFYGGAAVEITSSLEDGDGWMIVSERDKVTLVEGADAADCVKVRVVVLHTSGKADTPDGTPTDFVEVELGPETPWIAVESGVPTHSGPSLKAAKIASDAVRAIDGALPDLERAVEAEPNPDLRAEGVMVLAALKGQRDALMDLIQKHGDSVESNKP